MTPIPLIPIPSINAEQEQPDYYKRQHIREEIYSAAGDLESLVGTLSDTVHVLLVSFSRLVTQLNHAVNLAEIRAAAEPLKIRFESLEQSIEAKTLQFPYQIKSIEEVIHEIIKRASAISRVFILHQGEQGGGEQTGTGSSTTKIATQITQE